MNNELLTHGEHPMPEETLTQRPHKIFASALSVAEVNQLRGSYNTLAEQNRDLQRDLNNEKGKNDALKQKFDELSAGVLMIAQLLNIDSKIGADVISQIACKVEELPSKSEKLKALLSRENLLNMTKECIEIEEILNDNDESEIIRDHNVVLWEFVSDLAEAQGIILPEYTP